MTGRTLPLAVWAAVLTTGSVLGALGVTAAALVLLGSLDRPAVAALLLGAAAGLCLCAGIVQLVRRGAGTLRALRDEAVERLQQPSRPVQEPGGRARVPQAAAELADLAAVLEALHVRVRLGDSLGERHRRQAETAGAGVFELLSGLVAAEEGARGQLAAELHDTVAQSLMMARGLLSVERLSPGDLTRVGDLVEDAEEQVRAVMAHTRPPALREGDLAAAVANLRLDLQTRYGLEVTVRWPPLAHPLPLASAVTVYRFFQESLLNVVKHADVDRAVLELTVSADAVRATVSDRGPGFDPAGVRPDRGRHVGLGLLRERARLSGGSLSVDSGQGAGTVVTLQLPMAPSGPAAAPVLLLAEH